MDENRGLSYFLLGLGIGVAVGMVFAPASGEETRGRLRNRATEGGDYLRRRGTDLRESAVDLIDKGKTAVRSQREQMNAAVEAGRQAYRDTIADTTPSSPSPAAINPEGV